MLPSRDALKAITIYPRYERPDGTIKPMRRVLYPSSWEDKKTAIAMETGAILKEPVFIRVFGYKTVDGLIFVPVHEWQKLDESELDGYWTADPITADGTLILPWNSDREFSWGTSAEVTRAENEYRLRDPTARRVKAFADNRKRWGAHIRLQAG